MKRYEYEKAVYESAADSIAKGILIYYGHRKNWAADGRVWVSAATVARDIGLSVSSVNRRVPKLRDSGWLIPTGHVVGNGAVEYDLAIGQPFATEEAGATPVSEPDTTSTQANTRVTERATTRTETDKEVTNKEDKKMKEEVITDADAPVEDSSSVKESVTHPTPSSNYKSPLRLQSERIYKELLEERNLYKQTFQQSLDERVQAGHLSPERADGARRLFASAKFRPNDRPGRRAEYALYWCADADRILASPEDWTEQW